MTAEEIRKFAWEVAFDEQGKLPRMLAEIAAQLAEANKRGNVLASICGDGSGPRGRVCALEPGHPGDHRSYHSSGGCIGWPQRKEQHNGR
ncbi:MAG: hypothetical protein E6H00_12990 [Bacillati bacterium ANGP1]|uniref:Uncharacterized protein n=1 Tax=Candidatus Segetimicrobium genomatis TaxID=2569760 RepID=A0A537JXS7_9BACT|nr:MAG: hypothetical protein E6H00_12990 [Terrabacteria group bacterium ANGP1]